MLLFLKSGAISEEEVENSVKLYLVGEEPIAGILMVESGEKLSIYQAWKRGYIRRGRILYNIEFQL